MRKNRLSNVPHLQTELEATFSCLIRPALRFIYRRDARDKFVDLRVVNFTLSSNWLRDQSINQTQNVIRLITQQEAT